MPEENSEPLGPPPAPPDITVFWKKVEVAVIEEDVGASDAITVGVVVALKKKNVGTEGTVKVGMAV